MDFLATMTTHVPQGTVRTPWPRCGNGRPPIHTSSQSAGACAVVAAPVAARRVAHFGPLRCR